MIIHFEYTQRYKKTRKELKEYILENYNKRIGFTKKNSNCSMKHQKKKDLLLLPTKLIKKSLLLTMLKNTMNHF